MNLVESWFSILTRQSVRRGSYRSVADLTTSIERFVDGYNQRAKPFVWTKTASDILSHAKPRATSETEH